MPIVRPLTDRTIAISVSDSPDLAELGLGHQHLRDAMVEIARHLLAAGAHLLYGGDLRALGFTELLLELAARHRLEDPGAPASAPAVTNYLAWPVHLALSAEELSLRIQDLGGVGELVFLGRDGVTLSEAERVRLPTSRPSRAEWRQGLTAMRHAVNQHCDVRVLLGGQVEGYQGTMPGIAEEAVLAFAAQKPVFLLGGFGGCSRDIAETLGLVEERPVSRVSRWKGRRRFVSIGPNELRNGLATDDNARLVRTAHVDEMTTLILRGLGELFARSVLR